MSTENTVFRNIGRKGVDLRMPEVRIRPGESIDKALRRFKRLCGEDFKEMKRRRHYVKPSDNRRRRKERKKGQKV